LKHNSDKLNNRKWIKTCKYVWKIK
jgi:hypothetical protein